jgi:hypothetical protein
MGNKLLIQVVLIITSITIIVTYVRPAFTEIAAVQDDIARYSNTVSKAAQLNAELQNLTATERSISAQEVNALLTYLPNEINDVTIMRDIQNIFKIVNIPLSSLASVSSNDYQASASVIEGRELEADGAPALVFRDFKMSFFGTFDHLKLIMQGMELNAYPLEVVELSSTAAVDLSAEENDLGLPPGVMKYDLTLRAFALPGTQ